MELGRNDAPKQMHATVMEEMVSGSSTAANVAGVVGGGQGGTNFRGATACFGLHSVSPSKSFARGIVFARMVWVSIGPYTPSLNPQMLQSFCL